MDCDIILSEFELHLRYYVQFWTNTAQKAMHFFIPFAKGWNYNYCSSTIDGFDIKSHTKVNMPLN